MKRHKYHAKPQRTSDGFFASKAELQRFQELCVLQAAGEISGLKRQVRYPLVTVDTYSNVMALKIGSRQVCYVADFVYFSGALEVVEDVKGVDLPIAKLKRALFTSQYGKPVTIITKGRSNGKRAKFSRPRGRKGNRRADLRNGNSADHGLGNAG